MEIKGKVVWTRPSVFLPDIKDRKHFDVGIEFVEISREDRNRLICYIEKYSAKIPPSKNNLN